MSVATATDPASASWSSRIRKAGRSMTVWLFLAPALLLFLYFKFIPMFEGIRMSMHKVRPFLGDQWVGADNYVKVATDPRFHDAIWHTLVLGIGGSIGAVLGGLALALVLEGASRTLWFARTAIFLPVVTATAVIGEVWRIIYFPSSEGYLNHLLGFVGLGPVGFLQDESTALGSVLAVGIWQGAPYNMVIFLAGLAGVDRTLYEASALDGAGVWQRIRHVTLPALKPAMTVVLILASIRSLRVFTDVWVLTNGGPAGATDVWMTRTYALGFERNDLGVAAAASMILLAVTVLLTLGMAALTRNRKGD